MLSTFTPSFVRRHSLAISLLGVVAACGIIIPACNAGHLGPDDPAAANKPTTISLSPTATDVYAGQSIPISAGVTSGGVVIPAATITYTIAAGDAAYATIAGSTLTVPLPQNGDHTVTITATATVPSGYDAPSAATAQIKVHSRITNIAVSAPPATFRVGDQATLVATPTIASLSPASPAPAFSWLSSNPAAVSVDATGKITAVAVTSSPVMITATSEGTTSTAVLVSVTAMPPTIVIAPKTTTTLGLNQTQQYTATTTNPSGGTATFIRRAGAAANFDVTATGLVTAKAATPAGSPVYIIASYTSGAVTVFDSAAINIVAPTIALTPKIVSVQAGLTTQLTATVTNPGLGGTAIGYTTRDPSKALASTTGLVTGVAATATGVPVYVVASYANGGVTVLDSAAVTVTAVAATPIITFSPATITVGVASSTQVSASVANPTANGTLVLSIPTTGVASFSQSTSSSTGASGSLSGQSAGTATLVATYNTGTSTFTNQTTVTVNTGAVTSRVNRIILEPRDAEITAPLSLPYKIRFLDAAGAATTPELTDGGSISIFNSRPQTATITQSITDPTSATAASVAAGVTNFTVLYSKNGQNIAIDNTNLTVNAAATSGNYGSVVISTAADTRTVRVGQSFTFQVIVRNQSNVIQTSGVTGLTVTPDGTGAIGKTAAQVDPTDYFFSFTGVSTGTVVLKATVQGASYSIPITITP